ncbi:MAG: ABC transporter permease [Rhodanobacter sp.]
MFGYYLDLARRSLQRTPVLTGLMVLAIGLGIGASMTMLTVLHVMTDDPMPGRSAYLFRPYLNPVPLRMNRGMGPDPSINLTWPDAMALLHARKGTYQAAMAGNSLVVTPVQGRLRPFTADGRMTTRDLFAMFGLRFVAGAAWSAEQDDGAAAVVVVSRSFAQRVFGKTQVVGSVVSMGGHDFRVIGVVSDWAPRPMFYVDASEKRYAGADAFFMPLSTGMALNLGTNGNQSGWGSDENNLHSPTVTWLQFWVELDSPAAVAGYRRFLYDYAASQKAAGRFQQPASTAHLYGLMGWLGKQHIVPGDVNMQAGLALIFFGVCLLNIVALLLAKYLRRAAEVSVRRALGACRRDIFVQFSVESALIGLLGGAVGLVAAELGLWSVRQRPDDYAHLARMDLPMLALALTASVLASVAAGVLPAWRAASVAPAMRLKSQ